MAFGVFGLITAEFLPVSLLTPIVASLQVSEVQGGQTSHGDRTGGAADQSGGGQRHKTTGSHVVMLAFTLLLVASALLGALAS